MANYSQEKVVDGKVFIIFKFFMLLKVSQETYEEIKVRVKDQRINDEIVNTDEDSAHFHVYETK